MNQRTETAVIWVVLGLAIWVAISDFAFWRIRTGATAAQITFRDVQVTKSGDGMRLAFVNGGQSPAPASFVVTDLTVSAPTPDQFQKGVMRKTGPISIGEHEWKISTKGVEIGSGVIASGGPLYVYGILGYCDVFKKFHASRFCFFRENWRADLLDICEFGNELDNPADIAPWRTYCTD